MSERILGIDLGTTNSLVSVFEGSAATVLTSYEGERIFPSAVAFTDKGELLVGEHAKRQAVLNAKNTILSVKRLIGRKFYTEDAQKVVARSSVLIKASERGEVIISLQGKEFTPEEITAIVLRRLREIACDHFQEEITKAVVGVPAYFNFNQREATRNAGRIAHLDVVRVVSEPTAAAIAFGLGKGDERLVAVYDLGGGTFDISIMHIHEGTFRVRAVSGDNQLGGDDFDNRIVDWIVERWRRDNGTDLAGNPAALQRVREAAEFAKKDLSLSATTSISIPFLAPGKDGQQRHFNQTLSRAEYEKLVGDLVDRTFSKCEEALRLAGLKPYDVTEVILVGGQTRSPIVFEKVARFWNKMPIKGVNPDEAVSIGAAIHGAVLGGLDLGISLQDVTSYSIGIEIDGGKMSKVIPRNTTIPVSVKRLFTTFHDNQEYVTVNVLQGESDYAAYNHSLVTFDLAPLPKAPKGEPDVEVEFGVDASGLVSVTATDQKTGKAQNVRITDSNILTVREVQSLERRVAVLMDLERDRRDLAQLRNHAKYLMQRMHAFMLDRGVTVGEGKIARLSQSIGELERVAAFEQPSLIDAARRVIEREQAAFMTLVRDMRASFDVKPL